MGYRLPTDENGNPVVTEIEASVNSTTKQITLYINGKQQKFDDEGNILVSRTTQIPEITMKVVNEVGYLLPQTGSSKALIYTATGVLLFVTYLIKSFKRKEN